MAERHTGRDFRKESWRPEPGSVKPLGEPIPAVRGGDWSAHRKYVLKNVAASMEELRDRQNRDATSLGILRPCEVQDLVIKHPKLGKSGNPIGQTGELFP